MDFWSSVMKGTALRTLSWCSNVRLDIQIISDLVSTTEVTEFNMTNKC